MKKTLFNSFFLTLIVALFSANSLWAQEVTPIAFDPADNSTVGSYFVASFTAKFDEALTLDNSKAADIKLYKGSIAAENEIAPEAGEWTAQLQNGKKDLNIFSMDEYYEGVQIISTEQGAKYILVIPAGIVKNAAGATNAELTLTLNGPVPPLNMVSANPANNSDVTGPFAATFNITFDKDITIVNSKASDVKLYIDAVGGEEIAPESGSWSLDKESDGKTLRIYSLDEYYEGLQFITPAPGKKYILVVPAGTVKNGSSENKEIKITLNGPTLHTPIAFDPAENSTLPSYFSAAFTVKFNEELTLDQTKVSNIKLYEKIGETTTELTPDDAWYAALESGKKNLYIHGDDYDGFTQGFAAKEGAKYQLVIPAGIVKNAAGTANAELTLTLNGPTPTISLVSTDPANNTRMTETFVATFNFTFDKEITIDNSKASDVKLYVDAIGGTEIAPESGAWSLSKESDKKTLRIFGLDEYGEGPQFITPEAGKKYILVVPAGIVKHGEAKSKETTLTLEGPELIPTVLELESSNPANGATLDAGYHAMSFELTFAEATTTTSDKLNAGVTLTKNDTKVDVESWGFSMSNSGKTVQLFGMDMDGYTDSYKVEEGDVFVLTIAKAVFTTNANGQNDEITITLNGPAAPIVFNPTTIVPGDGDELNKFFGNYAMPHLELTFDENIAQVLTSKPAIELRKGSVDGEVLPISGWKAELVDEHPNQLTLDAWDYNTGNNIWFEAEDVYYYWIIPAGIVKNAEGGQNEQIVLKQKGIVKDLTVASTTPADKGTIKPGYQYYQFYVTFEEDIQIANATPNDIMFYENGTEKLPLGADEMYGGTVDVWHAMKEDAKTLYIWGDDGYQMVDTYNAVDGATYKLVIPAGVVKDAAGNYNGEITIEFTCTDGIPKPVVVPDNLQTEIYIFTAKADEYGTTTGPQDYTYQSRIGFDGNDVYIKGLSENTADMWLKATKNEAGQYVIPANQYMGQLNYGGWYVFDYYLAAKDENDKAVDVMLDFNTENNQFTTNQTVVLNGAVDEWYPYLTFTEVAFTKYAETAATPVDPTIESVALKGNYPYIRCTIPAVGTNGETLNKEKLYYTVWIEKDGQQAPYTFTAARYGIDEDKTEIPYLSGYDLAAEFYDIYFQEAEAEMNNWAKIGIQSIYYGGDECHKSNIVWKENGEYTGIAKVSGKKNDAHGNIFNMAGQRVNNTTKGIYIMNGKKVVVK